jgi:MFS family permease
MKANKYVYCGIFLASLATLMYELLLTRIFSVTTWYHFAFLAISMAMFGTTMGAIIVYLAPDRFTPENTSKYQAWSILAFAVSCILAIVIHISVPAFLPLDASTVIVASLFIAVPFLLVAFTLSSICISLTLTRYPAETHKLYAADFIGAAVGCVLLVGSLQFIDGITDVYLIGFIATLSALCFSFNTDSKKLKLIASALALLSAGYVGTNAYLANQEKPVISLSWSKGEKEKLVLFEKWNCFSRIRVFGEPDALRRPLEFGYSKLLPDVKIRQLWLDMDGCAAAILYRFNGNIKDFEFFKYDISNFAYNLIKGGNALVIGVGGGKDILAALALGQKTITGVEINNNTVATITGRYGDYIGHLDKMPGVKLVCDEARSYITRSTEKYDTIQATLVDTWAASSSGAYALTESSLYTVDAWQTFLEHLSDRGMLTMTRWYSHYVPSEVYRLVGVGSAALKAIGVENPRAHLVLVRLMSSELGDQLHAEDGLGTILVSRQPFSMEQLTSIDKYAKELGFEVALSPVMTIDPNLALAAEGKTSEVEKTVPYNLKPSTDDCPFFFQTLNPTQIFNKTIYAGGRTSNNINSAVALLLVLVTVTFFTFYCFRLPILRTKDKSQLKGSLPLFVYFFSIGIGFMLIELSQVQRFSITLGHPIYALAVVLFTLFLATGLGSVSFGKLCDLTKNQLHMLLVAVLVVTAIFGLATPTLVHALAPESTAVRIGASVASLFPVGFVLGLGFPAGMRLGFKHGQNLTAWLWGINGAASVLGSVLSVVLSMFVGISTSYWCGFIFYAIALYCCITLEKREPIRAEAAQSVQPESSS